MNNRYENAARYEVMAWDGCGYWRIHYPSTRNVARMAKRMFRRNTEAFTYAIERWCDPPGLIRIPVVEVRDSWPAVKIWDRKHKEFIT